MMPESENSQQDKLANVSVLQDELDALPGDKSHEYGTSLRNQWIIGIF
jgi:hypothetical protein